MPLLAVLLYSGSKAGKRLWRVVRIFHLICLASQSVRNLIRKHEGNDNGLHKQMSKIMPLRHEKSYAFR